MSDASGNLLAEIDYLDYGEPVYMPVLASPPQDDITNSVYDSGNKTTLIISDYVGKQLQPNIANSSTVSIADWDNMTNTLYVQGDITSYVAAGDAYRVEMPDGGAATHASAFRSRVRFWVSPGCGRSVLP